MTNMYMNYQEELDQYYNVDEGTIPQTQIQEDDEISVGERKPHQLNIDENLVMNTIGLELDNLSEKNEESCSISESLQSL